MRNRLGCNRCALKILLEIEGVNEIDFGVVKWSRNNEQDELAIHISRSRKTVVVSGIIWYSATRLHAASISRLVNQNGTGGDLPRDDFGPCNHGRSIRFKVHQR